MGKTIMTNDALIQQLTAQFYQDGVLLAKNHFEKNKEKQHFSKDMLLSVSENFYTYLDSFLDDFAWFAKEQNKKIDCKKGCDTCCYQAVFVSPFEAIHTAEYIRQHFSSGQQEKLRKKLQEKHEVTGDMDAATYLAYRHACPFLDENGSCIVHKARPVACRLFLSADVDTCKASHNNPKDISIFARLYDLPLKTGRAFCEGFNQWFADRGALSQNTKLEDAILIAMEHPDAADKWLQGENSFRAKYTDADIQVFSQYMDQAGTDLVNLA
ncbi:MAG: YkgJ family cysteine cluster protein [Bacteroidales bacterium]